MQLTIFLALIIGSFVVPVSLYTTMKKTIGLKLVAKLVESNALFSFAYNFAISFIITMFIGAGMIAGAANLIASVIFVGYIAGSKNLRKNRLSLRTGH